MQNSTLPNRPDDQDRLMQDQGQDEVDDEIVARLNHLIQLNLDAQIGYETAAEHVENGDYRRMLREYAAQRAQFADELGRIVRNEGEAPEENASIGGVFHQAWINLKAVLTNGDGAILAECRNADGLILRAYQDVIGEITAEPLLVILRRHLTDVRNAYERVRALSAALDR